SLVMSGAPKLRSRSTFRPRGPSVTLAVSARTFTPCRMPSRALLCRWTIFAPIVLNSFQCVAIARKCKASEFVFKGRRRTFLRWQRLRTSARHRGHALLACAPLHSFDIHLECAEASTWSEADGQPLETDEALRSRGAGFQFGGAHPMTKDFARIIRRVAAVATAAIAVLTIASAACASEAELVLPNLGSQRFVGVDGWTLLFVLGIVICTLGLGFGLVQYVQLRALPVHRAMREISELIYATCQAYLITQGRFILILEAFIGTIMVVYFKFL